MTFSEWLQIFFALLGLFCAGTVFLFRRFGPASWLLGCFLLFCDAIPIICIISGDPAVRLAEEAFRAAVSFMLVATPIGLIFAWSFNRANYRQVLAEKSKLIAAVLFPVPLLLLLLFVLRPALDEGATPEHFVALGPSGYLASLYLLVISVMGLSSLEQAVRCVEERVRWEIKFLALGLASSFAAIVYVASKALLFSFRNAFVPKDAFYVFTLIFPLSCVLILAAWRRSTGYGRIPVSQSLIYSSVTLLSVGGYLIISAVLARWVSSQGEFGHQTQGAVFLMSVVALATILMWTGFRHRVRNWIRRNVFAGKYDYRQFWMEATEKVRSVDGPESSALALAGIIQRALGAIDISIWLRNRNTESLRVAGALGRVAESQNKEIKGILEKFVEIADPVTVEEIEKMPDNAAVKLFSQKTGAAILVPLCSSERLVGLLAVGSDRSGRKYNWDTREFLRVLASHAASEFHKHELLGTLVAAKEAEAFKSFSTFLLHDLKNFASTLSLVAKNASRHQGNPDFQRDAFQSIFDTAEKMKRLCNNLRTFSSNLAANRKQDDLNRIVRASIISLNGSLSNQIHMELEELPSVFIDAEEVAKVLQNLLLNASEATKGGGAITVRTVLQNGSVELTVTDGGKGMTRDFLDKELFLPFRTTKSDGLGIGLFQCKKIIEAHNGRIQVTSEEGKGTVVSVSLPVGIQTVH
jgi:putative PEP-CTERM system histidine kinase